MLCLGCLLKQCCWFCSISVENSSCCSLLVLFLALERHLVEDLSLSLVHFSRLCLWHWEALLSF